ncbi:hypothetical protein ACROYT_G003303 [Oculina patagonica]
MSVIRFGSSLFRSLFKHLSGKGSGKVAAKSGLRGGVEIREGHSASTKQLVLASRASQNDASVLARGVWRGFTTRLGSYTQAASLRRMATTRLLRGCGPKAPVFAFLGIAYASSNVKPPKDVQEKEQFKELHQWIQEALRTTNMFAQHQENVDQPSLAQLKLKNYEVGERLGKSSSNSAVYAAKYMGHEYAVKMLFNFGAGSQSSTLHRVFAKEYQVLSVEKQQNSSQAGGPAYTSLPPHPNITPVLHAFADNIPCLPDAFDSYPAALPYYNGGYASNRTLFLVMPRYCTTVQEYIKASKALPPQVSTLLLLQLLEGIAHLNRHGVAHRDLKTDNLLLDESTSGLCPRLVIADFGCCLADRDGGLVLPFYTAEIDRGGNSNLMAPEIACAIPGQDSVLDYTNSDAWAAGAIAHELFGDVNPFDRDRLDSRTYQDEQLPMLTQAPTGARRVVSLLLRRDPSERITADIAVTMLTLVLWAPPAWLHSNHVSVTDINRWLIGLSVKMLVHKGEWTLEDEVLHRFLCRVSAEEITDALDLLTEEIE